MKARAMPFLLALAVLVPAVTAADPPAAGAQPPRAERLAWPAEAFRLLPAKVSAK